MYIIPLLCLIVLLVIGAGMALVGESDKAWAAWVGALVISAIWDLLDRKPK